MKIKFTANHQAEARGMNPSKQAVNSLFLLALCLQLLVLTLPVPIGEAGCLSLEFLIFSAGIHRAIGSAGMAVMRLGITCIILCLCNN